MARITIRVDDYPLTKDEERWRHNHLAFTEFHRVMLARTPHRYILGVIPGRLEMQDVLFLSSLERLPVIAVHGVKHSEMYQNEFREWLTEGDIMWLLDGAITVCSHIGGYRPWIYIPPHNVIDRKTVRALSSLGFEKIMGGPETDAKVASSSPIPFFISDPSRLEYGRSDELMAQGAVEALRSRDEDIVLTLHWTWETNIGLQHLDRLMSQIGDMVVEPT